MAKFVNKAVLVTGSSIGIGQSIAVRYAKEGGLVTIHGRDEAKLQKTRELMIAAGGAGDRILSVIGNVEEEKTAKELVEKTIQKWGKLDVLVNNAAVTVKPGIDPESIEAFDYIFSINLRGLIQLSQMALPHLIKSKGNVVSISSVVSTRPLPDLSFYSMTKSSVDQFSRLYALKYAKEGVRFNTVNPGFTRTSIFSRHAEGVDQEKHLDKFEQDYVLPIVPLGRMATGEEIADAVAFVSSQEAKYMTGAHLLIDGGFAVNSPSTGCF